MSGAFWAENLQIRRGQGETVKISSKDYRSVQVDWIRAHKNSDKPKYGKENYIGIIYYSGGNVSGFEALLLLKDASQVERIMRAKRKEAMHAALHEELSGETAKNFVATGFAIKDGVLRGNSTTFNSAAKDWLDKSFYNHNRTASADEMEIIRNAIDDFRRHTGKKEYWRYELKEPITFVEYD